MCVLDIYISCNTYSTILDQLKEKIVCSWTGQVRKHKNTTTNRVEYAHSTLKKWLSDSKSGWVISVETRTT